MYFSEFHNLDILFETDPDSKDIYYGYLKTTGLMDYVKDILRYDEEHGPRVEAIKKHKNSLVVDHIDYANKQLIQSSIETLIKIYA